METYFSAYDCKIHFYTTESIRRNVHYSFGKSDCFPMSPLVISVASAAVHTNYPAETITTSFQTYGWVQCNIRVFYFSYMIRIKPFILTTAVISRNSGFDNSDCMTLLYPNDKKKPFPSIMLFTKKASGLHESAQWVRKTQPIARR